MRALGADVEIVPSPDGITPQLIPRMIERARQIAEEVGGYWTDQFNNADMVEGYRQLGRELLAQLDGSVEAFCAYVGTAGCFVGVGRELRAALPDLLRVAVEPAESAVLSGKPAGTHHIEGGGPGFHPPQLRDDDFDEVLVVPEAEAFAMARRAAREDGIFSGPSTGANIV